MALRIRPAHGWSWILFSRLVSLALNLLILSGLPGDAIWILGIMAGINLFFSGLALMSLASLAKDH